MSERYSRLFSLIENLYSESSPVVIAAGALLKDNQSRNVLAQLKFKNISPKSIKALTVLITPRDVVGVELETVSHRYLDLNAGRDAEFCQKMPVSLPNAETRSFTATVTEVVFVDGSVWSANGDWEPMPAPAYLETGRDSELVMQYRLEYGADTSQLLQEHKDLWICTCGGVNRRGEETDCHICHRNLVDLQNISWDELEERKRARLAEEAARAENARIAAEAQAKKVKKLAAIVLPILAVIIAASALITGSVKKRTAYNEAIALAKAEKYAEAISMLEEAGYDNAEDLVCGSAYQAAKALFEAGDYEAAEAAFEKLGDYSDSAERAKEAADRAEEATKEAADRAEEARCKAAYEQAEEFLAQGDTAHAAMAFYEIADYKDAKERSFTLWGEIVQVHDTISARGLHTVSLKADGTVVAAGYDKYDQCNVSEWNDVVAVSAHVEDTIGLKTDGTVVAAGGNQSGQLDVSGWKNVVAVSAGWYHTVGLKSDGTVIATGKNNDGKCNVSGWNNIVAVSAGNYHTIGLKSDGTVVAVGDNTHGQCDVSDWKGIVAVSAGYRHTVGLKADGTVVAVGDDYYGQCDVSDWKNIVAVAAGELHTVGLKTDGTVVARGNNNHSQCSVFGWKDIVAISAGGLHTVGLKADGTMAATNYFGDYYAGQCEVSDWNNIKLP